MTARVNDGRRRRVLHELFEENEARADLLERMVHSDAGFEAFRIRGRMNWIGPSEGHSWEKNLASANALGSILTGPVLSLWNQTRPGSNVSSSIFRKQVLVSMSGLWRYQRFLVFLLIHGDLVRRVCRTIWRRGETIGARFMSAKELRTMAPSTFQPPPNQRVPEPEEIDRDAEYEY
jgi:hypothetical protein